MHDPTLVIVPGATGSLGEGYLRKLSKNYACVGLSRREPKNPIDNVRYLKADLLDEALTREQIESVSFDGIERVVLIHPVGKFKFEENGDSGRIDPSVLRSNFDTFYHVVNPILEQSRDGLTKLTLVAFGSVSDKYGVPYWQSYSRSKTKLKEFMKDLCGGPVRGVFVNISSTGTTNEDKLRPNADKTYWLTPEKVVDQSLPTILAETPEWTEIEVFEPKPGFDESYYHDHAAILEKWRTEMGKSF